MWIKTNNKRLYKITKYSATYIVINNEHIDHVVRSTPKIRITFSYRYIVIFGHNWNTPVESKFWTQSYMFYSPSKFQDEPIKCNWNNSSVDVHDVYKPVYLLEWW